jgi:hypothetical protein
MPIGGNATYRPGVKMVKITTDPKVYAVAKGGVLRHVSSESIAASLYGADWNRSIDDVPDAFFADYRLGEPIAAVSAYDPVAEQLASPTIGADRGLEAAASGPPTKPTFSVRPLTSTAVRADTDATLLEVRLASPTAVRLLKLPVRLEAMDGNFPSPDLDEGGLVRGNGERLNLSQLRFVDRAGATPLGAIDPALDAAKDQSQLLPFGGSVAVPAGGEAILTLKARFDIRAPAGERYRASIPVREIELVDEATGLPVPFAPIFDLVAETALSVHDGLGVSLASEPAATTYVRGESGVPMAGFVFTAPAGAASTLRTLVFQGYIDEQEGIAGFTAGADADDGVATAISDLVSALSIYDGDTRLSGPVAVDLNGRVRFNLSYMIPAATRRALTLKADLRKDASIGNFPDLLSFDLAEPSTDVVALGASGARTIVTAQAPNGRLAPRTKMTVLRNGSASFSWTGRSADIIAGRQETVGTFSVMTAEDAFTLTSVAFATDGDRPSALDALRVSYKDAQGNDRSSEARFLGNVAQFLGLALPLAEGADTRLDVAAVTLPRTAGTTPGQSIKLRLVASDGLSFVSGADGRTYTQQDLGGHGLALGTNQVSAMAVRLTGLVAGRDAASPQGIVPRATEAEVLRFTLRAEPEGPARVRKLAFKIKPSDAGTPLSDSDALERWADLDGDAADDNLMATLRKLVGSSREAIGEGFDAKAAFSIVHLEAKDDTPQGLDTSERDYGLLEFIFTEGFEPRFPAGETLRFALDLDTTRLASGTRALEVGLLGGGDFEWIDTEAGFQDSLAGWTAAGLPVESPLLTVP